MTDEATGSSDGRDSANQEGSQRPIRISSESEELLRAAMERAAAGNNPALEAVLGALGRQAAASIRPLVAPQMGASMAAMVASMEKIRAAFVGNGLASLDPLARSLDLLGDRLRTVGRLSVPQNFSKRSPRSGRTSSRRTCMGCG